jgi:phosphotransferase system HPr-like phosphotransfer protein
LMMLAAGMGSKIQLRAAGLGAETAIESLRQLIERKFDEE